MTPKELQEMFRTEEAYRVLLNASRPGASVHVGGLVGSSVSVVAANLAEDLGGIHLMVVSDRDAAGYLYNDLSAFLTRDRGERTKKRPQQTQQETTEVEILFFPTAYKRSVQFGQEDPAGIIQRTAVLNALKQQRTAPLIVCTYPEALVEQVVERDELQKNTLTIRVGDTLSPTFLEEVLLDQEFERVEFVYEPGQYSMRGGIFDLFSYADSKPYRVDFFGDEVDSIRRFEVASQLSVDPLQSIEVVPNLKRMEAAEHRTSFAAYAGEVTYWLADAEHTLGRFNEIRTKLLGEMEEPSQIDQQVTSRRAFLSDTTTCAYLLLQDNLRERVADTKITFSTAPQPSFNKKFELLAEDIQIRHEQGYRTYFLSENKAQVERLRNIFHSIGQKEVPFESLDLTLHGGFIDHNSRSCFYTDHQLFERHHRYHIRNELNRSESFTVQELNALQIGDYVVHIDHGVGRFGGLSRTVENGKVQEAIKLVYRDNDVLLVNVHALHRISRYKDKDADAPKIYKLGSGAWQRMKQSTKKAVKDIARELIALYAKRKASQGFAFSPDSYLQQELEASFIYEDTPDQQSTTEAIKADMERSMPMDRLVCGDVGFGKTEVAIRAAFKAVSDSKQVAVLVPTTILALQHYRTFNDRLSDFPVRVEHLSRSKSAKDTQQVLSELKAGKIDILIGTHKILGKGVEFKDLGLLIVDEEQKFGVAAKEKLRSLRSEVDTLTLTATPIPRTLQFSLMGSRDLSVITTPPPNRQPIATESHLFDEELIREAIEYELSRGGQVYFVHNRVENIERMQRLIHKLCPTARTVVGHGQMNPTQMEEVMMDFIYGEYDVLLATTIIESGVDVPNANTMIINNAQNFGLSDLHQLRGRVGRSNRKAFCYLLTPPDELLTSDGRRRLRAIEEFSDLGSGFNIAMQDLDIRGAGNLLGGEQSGFIADIGFETYQKILNEAMNELREEEHLMDENGLVPENDGPVQYLSDAQIETDSEAFIPDAYVGSSSEKLRLYRELDSTPTEEALATFESQLIDRFGPIPTPTQELFEVVRMRRICMELGFEKAIVKNGIMILQFIHDQQSSYYKTPLFGAILEHVSHQGSKFVMRQNNNKLSLVVRHVKGIGQATRLLSELRCLVPQASGPSARKN